MKAEIKCVGSKVSVVFTETSPFGANSVRYVDFYNNELEALTESLIQEDVLSLRIKNERLEKENAYLAGLKAGKPKWHKVADGDLPKGNCENILLYNKDHFCVTHSYSLGYYENGVFYNNCEMEEDTIAWCEIPQYTEE